MQLHRCRALINFANVFAKTIVLSIVLLSVLVGTAQADELPRPTGQILLEIVGNITHHNATTVIDGQSELVASFDLELLESLPSVTIKTDTPWTDNVSEFTGVRMDVLLKSVGAKSGHLSLEALDDYSVEVVDEMFDKYPIVLAYKLNGKYMSVRDLGPLWVMYPFDDFPELSTEQSRARCVWQLTRISVL